MPLHDEVLVYANLERFEIDLVNFWETGAILSMKRVRTKRPKLAFFTRKWNAADCSLSLRIFLTKSPLVIFVRLLFHQLFTGI